MTQKDTKSLREEFQYGTKTSVHKKKVNELLGTAKEVVERIELSLIKFIKNHLKNTNMSNIGNLVGDYEGGTWLKFFFTEGKYSVIQDVLREDSDRGEVFRDYCDRHPLIPLGKLKCVDNRTYRKIHEYELKEFVPSARSIKRYQNNLDVQSFLKSSNAEPELRHPMHRFLSNKTRERLYAFEDGILKWDESK